MTRYKILNSSLVICLFSPNSIPNAHPSSLLSFVLFSFFSQNPSTSQTYSLCCPTLDPLSKILSTYMVYTARPPLASLLHKIKLTKTLPSHCLRHILGDAQFIPPSPSLGSSPPALVGQQATTAGKISGGPALGHMPIPGPTTESREIGCYDWSRWGHVPALQTRGPGS